MENLEDMKTFVKEYFMGASTNASTTAPMEETSMEAFVEAFMEVMKHFADVTVAFEELTSTEAILKLPWKLSWKV